LDNKAPEAFRTISEVADELDLPQHVLRFWETRFRDIKPMKRGGGRRYYRPEDVSLLKGIRYLLYDQGFTIKGVQRILKDQGVRQVVAIGQAESLEGVEDIVEVLSLPDAASNPALGEDERKKLNDVLKTLLECKRALDLARQDH